MLVMEVTCTNPKQTLRQLLLKKKKTASFIAGNSSTTC